MSNPEVSIVTAITETGGMADDGNGRAAWPMPEDLARFKEITLGHPVVIAEPTFRTVFDILGTPLPGRTNIVVAPTKPVSKACLIVPDIANGIAQAKSLDSDEIFVMGNQSFYEAAWPYVTKLYLTVVLGSLTTREAFPGYDDFETISEQHGLSGGFNYRFQVLQRSIASI